MIMALSLLVSVGCAATTPPDDKDLSTAEAGPKSPDSTVSPGLVVDGGASTPVTAETACRAFGDRLAGCIIEDCPDASLVQVGLAAAIARACRQSIAAGVNDWQAVHDTVNADTQCSAYFVQKYIADATAADPEPGFLTALCIQGPAMAAVSCRAACDVLIACELAGSFLQDSSICLYACVATPNIAERFMCANNAPNCEAMASCWPDGG